jgi:uncharacterized protein (TIGR02246 family)
MAPTSTIGLLDLQACERACTRLVHDFAAAVDARQYDAFVGLFAPDGVFDRAGQVSRGHTAIRHFLDARPADRVTRHVCTNLRIDATRPDAASGNCYALVFQSQASADMPLPLPTPTPMVVEYLDDYRLVSEGWKFAHRRVRIIFQP